VNATEEDDDDGGGDDDDASALARYGEGDQFGELSLLGFGRMRGAGGTTLVKKTR
jgi:hypothetical protein